MAESGSYTPVFTVEVAEFLYGLPKPRQRRALRLAQTLAAHPFVRSDYVVVDETGRRV